MQTNIEEKCLQKINMDFQKLMFYKIKQYKNIHRQEKSEIIINIYKWKQRSSDVVRIPYIISNQHFNTKDAEQAFITN